MSNWAAAFLLLAGLVVFGIAGIAAVSASHEDVDSTLNGSGVSEPGVVGMGEDVQSALLTALPWLALAAVPMGIVGILAAVAFIYPSTSSMQRR